MMHRKTIFSLMREIAHLRLHESFSKNKLFNQDFGRLFETLLQAFTDLRRPQRMVISYLINSLMMSEIGESWE